jgi:hypothetical protein
MPKVSVFLSHSVQDKPFVRLLSDHLRKTPQIGVWLDEAEIAPGYSGSCVQTSNCQRRYEAFGRSLAYQRNLCALVPFTLMLCPEQMR